MVEFIYMKIMSINNKKNSVVNAISGFTLIEMLVVIAIIGILSAAVLVALGPSRNKAKDSRIVSDLQQARAIAETLYNPASASPYGSINLTTGQLKTIADDILTQNSTLQVNPASPSTAYAFYAFLSDGTTYYCVDSSGNVFTTIKVPASGVCQN